MEIANFPMISLQRQALTNFASSVWVKANKQSLRSFLDKLKFDRNFNRYYLEAKPLNDQAIAELERSNIPTLFKETTMMILTDVGYEIMKWLREIKDHIDDTTLEKQLSNLSWTVEGPLNRPKMARLLLENQSDLDLSFSFDMACEYCLEDEVRELWPRVREERQLKDFDDEDLMVQYWIYKLDEHLLNVSFSDLDEMLDLDVKWFLRVVYSGYTIYTVKFLFNSLSVEKKTEALNSFKSSSPNSYYDCDESVFGYVLSQFNVTEMCDVISRYEFKTLMTEFDYFAWPNTEFLKAFDQYIGKMEGTKNTNGNELLKLADGSFEYFRRYNREISFRYYWSRFSNFSTLEDLPSLLDTVFYQLCRDEDDVSIKMVIDSLGPKVYPENTCVRCDIVCRLAELDLNLLKYYLARAVNTKTEAETLIQELSEYHPDFVPFKDIIADILIELFPHWNLNRIN